MDPIYRFGLELIRVRAARHACFLDHTRLRELIPLSLTPG